MKYLPFLLPLSLMACTAVGPDYEAPVVELSEAHRADLAELDALFGRDQDEPLELATERRFVLRIQFAGAQTGHRRDDSQAPSSWKTRSADFDLRVLHLGSFRHRPSRRRAIRHHQALHSQAVLTRALRPEQTRESRKLRRPAPVRLSGYPSAESEHQRDRPPASGAAQRTPERSHHMPDSRSG